MWHLALWSLCIFLKAIYCKCVYEMTLYSMTCDKERIYISNRKTESLYIRCFQCIQYFLSIAMWITFELTNFSKESKFFYLVYFMYMCLWIYYCFWELYVMHGVTCLWYKMTLLIKKLLISNLNKGTIQRIRHLVIFSLESFYQCSISFNFVSM